LFKDDEKQNQILGQDYKLFLAQTTATFLHVSDKTKGLSQTRRYLLQHPISAVETWLDLHSSKHAVLQCCLEANHHQQFAYIDYKAVTFLCKLQQHFPVDNTDIQKLQWNSSLVYYKQYNQAMLRSLQNFIVLHSQSGWMSLLLQYGWQN